MAEDKEIKVEVNNDQTATAAADDKDKTSDDNLQAEDTSHEPAENEPESADSESETTLSREEELTRQVAMLEDQLLRAAAELDNYKKRTARRMEQILQTSKDPVLVDLLEVMDNFERALAQDDGNSEVKAYRDGMQLIYEQLKNLLGRHNVTPIEAIGKPFDPNLHEALMQTESDKYPEGCVAVEITKGYRMGDRVIRHSKVGVVSSSAKSKANESDDGLDDAK